MRFQLIGLNHKSAPVEVRERLAIPESRLPEACKRLSQHPGIEEGMIASARIVWDTLGPLDQMRLFATGSLRIQISRATATLTLAADV